MQEADNYQSKKTNEVSKTTPICVLHVDDDPSLQEISKQILMDMGSFEIENTYCVDEALKKLAAGIISRHSQTYKNPNNKLLGNV